MSRIDNAVLQLQLTPKAALGSKIRVYATNYNVLRIMSGIKYDFTKNSLLKNEFMSITCAEQLAANLVICILNWINSVMQIYMKTFIQTLMFNVLCNQLVSV
jgi:hypothetical protein